MNLNPLRVPGPAKFEKFCGWVRKGGTGGAGGVAPHQAKQRRKTNKQTNNKQTKGKNNESKSKRIGVRGLCGGDLRGKCHGG